MPGQTMPCNFHGDPLVVDSLILTPMDVVEGVGQVAALDRRSGAPVWYYPEAGGFSTDLILDGLRLFAVSTSDELHCLDVRSGELLWFYRRESELHTLSVSPVVVGPHVIFGARDGTVTALRADSGGIVWQRQLDDRVATHLLAHGAHVYCGTASGMVYKLRAQDGRIADSLELPGPLVGHPLLVGGLIVFIADSERELAAVDTSLSGVVWTSTAEGAWSSHRPRMWGSWILGGDSKGRLVALSPTDGSAGGVLVVGGTVRGIGHHAGAVYVGTLEGVIHVYATGE